MQKETRMAVVVKEAISAYSGPAGWQVLRVAQALPGPRRSLTPADCFAEKPAQFVSRSKIDSKLR